MARASTILLVLFFVASASALVLQRGDRGPDVFALQYLLRQSGRSLTIDGDYGPGTEAAVTRFQTINFLSPNGVFNQQTFSRLIVTVRRGSSMADAVRACQYLLVNKWFTLSGAIDGNFGPGTETAAKDFQFSRGLLADGVIGPASWEALFNSQSASSPPSGGGSVTPAGTREQLAQQLLSSSRISLASVHVDQSSVAMASSNYARSTARRNMEDQAAGITPFTSCYGNAPCRRADMSISMLRCLVEATNTLTVSISSIVGSSHSASSKHYNGWAFDANFVNGVHVRDSTSNAIRLSAICRQFGATVVLDPSNEPRYHHNHVHCQWNTSS